MEIRRFFLNNDSIIDNYILVEGEEFLHMTKVLRYKVGFKVIVCLDDGLDYYGSIMQIEKNFAKIRIDYVERNPSLPNHGIHIYQAMPKGDKLDLICQKAVELGVASVTPFFSQFTNEKKCNVDRLQKISKEASKQCGMAKLLEVSEPVTFDEMLELACKSECVIMPYENATYGSLSAIENFSKFNDVSIIIGSEGGFSEEEVEKARLAGIKVISLGRRILRCETAAIVTAALVMYELGELKR